MKVNKNVRQITEKEKETLTEKNCTELLTC